MKLSSDLAQKLRIAAAWLLASLLIGSTGQCQSAWYIPESAGVRGAFSGNSRSHNFHEAEAFCNWNLPWNWDLGRGWDLQTELALGAGWLADPGKNVAILSLGPALALRRANFPLFLEGGSSPTWISDHHFATKNMGEDFQFTTYIGLNWDVSTHFRLLYRFQHMSNAGIASTNPGLNLNAFGVSYRF